mmetsp:Transcript_8983/g.13961  ORF Transcript_8983/g.13961 Transcript_8983/m.13961 type:complete len:453 (+) Transcript_8983:1-1359(+)
MESSTISLPGYECQLKDDGVAHSRIKIDSATKDLASLGYIDRKNIHQLPCRSHDETIRYRNNCAFQMIIIDGKRDGLLGYAMRSEQIAIPLNGDYFPIATRRIQQVMKLTAKNLNATTTDDKRVFRFPLLRTHLSSVSFVSSWNDTMDCIVTLNYCLPIYVDNDNKAELLSQAEILCTECQITSLILRSKKKMEVVGRAPPYINDTLYLNRSSDDDKIHVQMERQENDTLLVPVYYRKPQDAFQHPNGNTMIQALQWMLNKLQTIRASDYSNDQTMNLLEMYCGAGAHTIPIAVAGLFDNIVTVELDQRLVEACQVNTTTNGCCDGDKTRTPVHVFAGDAGEWASRCLSWKQKHICIPDVSSKQYWQSTSFQVLLVDPPRAGLDRNVCHLASHGSFEHIIYISCGRQALLKDLKELSHAFDILDCTITDLFPRTSSVETLVHLRRKKMSISN